MIQSYKQSHPLELRRQRCKEQKEKFPDMIPTIIEVGKKSSLTSLPRQKFLINNEYLISSLKQTIMLKLQVEDQKKLIFIYCQNRLLNENMTVLDVYNKFKDPEDEMLYLTYTDIEALG